MRALTLAAVLVLGFLGPIRADLGTHSTDSYSHAGDGVGAASIRLAQSDGLVIDAPRRITTDQETVDFTGSVVAPGEARLSVDGIPVAVGADGGFRIRREVPVGRSEASKLHKWANSDNLRLMRQGNGGLRPQSGQQSPIAREGCLAALLRECRNSVVLRRMPHSTTC